MPKYHFLRTLSLPDDGEDAIEFSSLDEAIVACDQALRDLMAEAPSTVRDMWMIVRNERLEIVHRARIRFVSGPDVSIDLDTDSAGA